MKKVFYAVLGFGLLMLTAAPTLAKPAKTDVCHVNGNGDYHLINISERAVDAHMDHGDALPGDDVPSMEGYEFTDTCEMEETAPDITTETFEGWPVNADSEFGELYWQAEGRFGSNTDTGDWELGVGTDTSEPADFDEEQHVWGDSPVMQDFMVEYDADTGTATLTVEGDSTDYVVGTDSFQNLYLVARASFGADDYVELSNLSVNGNPLPDVMAEDGNVEALKVTGFDLTEDFTVEGTVEMEYTSTAGSAPAFQVQVSG